MKDDIAGNQRDGEKKLILLVPHHAPALALTDSEDFARLAANLDKLDGNHEVCLVLHDDRPEFDAHFATQLQTLLKDAMPRVCIPKTTDETITLYRKAALVVSVRMHPIIIGACAGAACVPISGSRKQDDLATRLKLKPVALRHVADLSLHDLRGWFASQPDPIELAELVTLAR